MKHTNITISSSYDSALLTQILDTLTPIAAFDRIYGHDQVMVSFSKDAVLCVVNDDEIQREVPAGTLVMVEQDETTGDVILHGAFLEDTERAEYVDHVCFPHCLPAGLTKDIEGFRCGILSPMIIKGLMSTTYSAVVEGDPHSQLEGLKAKHKEMTRFNQGNSQT